MIKKIPCPHCQRILNNMIKKIQCPHCHGTGETEIRICDKCGSGIQVGEYEGKDLCFLCWGKTLSAEDINNL